MSQILTILRQERREIEQQIRSLTAKTEALTTAIDALAPAKNGPALRRRRTKKRMSREDRAEQMVAIIQGTAPTRWTATEIGKQYDIPTSSAARALDDLLDRGRIVKIGETTRGLPIVSATGPVQSEESSS